MGSNPHDTPFTFVHDVKSDAPPFSPPSPEFVPPPARGADPHSVGYQNIGDDVVPVAGPVPANIVGGPLQH
jgi:hypothetical protein